ncbi:MAG: hypothetical protein COB08_018670 [Rhodobacteraceae bacterium]|nr:hypothetical protein [Paracoccaceae bacterium]
MEEQKTFLTEKISKCGQPLAPFEQIYRTAFDFLANPSKLWASERYEDKRAVLKLVFAQRLPYTRNEGYRTAKTSLPFRALEGLHLGKLEMVRLDGVEANSIDAKSTPDIEEVFQELERWNDVLKDQKTNILRGPQP